MPWYGYMHPAMVVITFGLGLATAQTSISKMNDWDFPMRRQRSRTIVFFLLCLANFAVGLFVNTALRGIHHGVKLTAHLPVSIAVMVVAFAAALVTFARSRPGEVATVMRWHSILMVACLALVLTMGFLSALILFSR
jgi:Mn2+/Fe2+ NRAMP family transporter